MTPDIWGHIFYANILIGTILLTKKKKIGWATRVIGDIGWAVIGYFIGMYSIMIWSSIFALNDFRGYLMWKWSEDENSKLQSKRPRFTEVRSFEDTRGLQLTGRRLRKPANGVPGTGHNAQCPGIRKTSAKPRVQKHQVISQPRRTRAGEVQRKTRTDASSRLEAAEKRVRTFNSIYELRNLSEPISKAKSKSLKLHRKKWKEVNYGSKNSNLGFRDK